MIRVVCVDKAHNAAVDARNGLLVIAGVCVRPRSVEEAGAVVLCGTHQELTCLVRAGYQPRLVPGLR